MEMLTRKGHLVFGIAIAALGIENLICSRFGLTVAGVPFFPARPFSAYLNAALFVAAGVCIAVNLHPRLMGTLLGYLLLGLALLRGLPQIVAQPREWPVYGVFFETVALGSSAWSFAQASPSARSRGLSLLSMLTVAGPYLFAVSLFIFGGIHFYVAVFIASLIPAWIPGRLWCAYFTGTAFIAAGISTAIRWMDQWAGFLLGVMFLLWFVFLHAPRVAADPRNPDEWSSAFIALAMCGGSWMVAPPSHSKQFGRQ